MSYRHLFAMAFLGFAGVMGCAVEGALDEEALADEGETPADGEEALADEEALAGEDVEPVDSEALALSTRVVANLATPFYVPPHVGGDREFKGHGPDMSSSVQLHIFNGNELWVSVYLNAIETKSDWTQSQGTAWYHLYTAPSNILSVTSRTSFAHSYRDNDHGHDYFSFATGNLVSQLDYVGDTSGDEAGTETGVRILFHPISMLLE